MNIDRRPIRAMASATAMWMGLAAHAACMEVIGHRGASGYLPEHTLAAYALAYGQGAQWIEPDVVLTRDFVPIALHDLTLEQTTDIQAVFPERHRADGHYHAMDFSLEEIARLRVVGRHPGQFPRATFRVPPLVEVLDLVDGLNRATGRSVGVYPELKHPDRQPQLAAAVLALLDAYDLPIRLQSFDQEALSSLDTDHARVQLVREATQTRDSSLDGIAGYAVGIGVSTRAVEADETLVVRAHERGLFVHVFTLRADRTRPAGSFFDQVRGLAAQGVDGIFTDHPDQARAAVASVPGCASDAR